MSLRDRFFPAPPPASDANSEAQAAQALSAQRGRMSVSAPPRAGKAAAAVLKPFRSQTGLGLTEMKRRWAEIAGESFARATPEKFAAGVLTLRAPSALAPFLQQQIPLLTDRLRTAGAKIKSVRIEQRTAAAAPSNIAPLRRPLSPAEEAALAQTLDHVGDPGLKSALMRLGRAMKQG